MGVIVFTDENGKVVNLDDMFSDSDNDWVVETSRCPIYGRVYLTDNAGQNQCMYCGYIKED